MKNVTKVSELTDENIKQLTSYIYNAIRESKPVLSLAKYKVVLCPKCKLIQVTTNKNRLICRNENCRHSVPFRTDGKWNVFLIETNVPSNATLFAQFWKADIEKYEITSIDELKKRFIEYLSVNRL